MSTASFLTDYLKWIGPRPTKNNVTASTNPARTDDTSKGYRSGSTWLRADTGDAWRCRDATANAAKWVRMAIATFPGYLAGNWYNAHQSLLAAGSALSSGTIKLIPFNINERVTLSDLGGRVTTTAAGGFVQFAIYASDPTTLKPTGTCLAKTESLSTTSAALVAGGIVGGSVQFEPGLYWAAINADNATVVMQALHLALPIMTYQIGSATQANINSAAGSSHLWLSIASTFNTWPDLTGGSFTEGTTAAYSGLQFKVASVP